MSLVKSSEEEALDAAAAAIDELTTLVGKAVGLAAGGEDFRTQLQSQHAALLEHLKRLRSAIRQSDQMPAAGNFELAEIQALGTKIKAKFTNEDEVSVMANDVATAYKNARQIVYSAIESIASDHSARQPLEEVMTFLGSSIESIGRYRKSREQDR